MEKQIFDNVKLLNSSIEKINKKTYETYLFQSKKTQFIVFKKRSLIGSFTTAIIKLSNPLKDNSIKTVNKFISKHFDTIKDTKKCEFTKGYVKFITKSGETYKFNVFGGFLNLIKAGCFKI